MTQELQIIDERKVLDKDFKIYGTVENPLFLAKDVAEWIDYAKSPQGYRNVAVMLKNIDDDEKIKLLIPTITNSNSRKESYRTEVSTLATNNVGSRYESHKTDVLSPTINNVYSREEPHKTNVSAPAINNVYSRYKEHKTDVSTPTTNNVGSREERHKTKAFQDEANTYSPSDNLVTSAWFLTEDGLYEVLMTSRKPIAKKFKSEVKKILKEIRRTGGYVADDEMFIKNYLPFADEPTKLLFKSTLQTVKQLNRKIEKDSPKVRYSNAVAASSDTSLVREFAKYIQTAGIYMGQNKLYEWFRDKGYLIKEGSDRNLPTQKSMNLGLFVISESGKWNYGKFDVYKTARITAKGRIYFLDKLIKDGQENGVFARFSPYYKGDKQADAE